MSWADPALSALFGGAYLALLSVIWLLMAVGVSGWGRRWTLVRPEPGPILAARKVSICIPARDEAHNIANAVRACRALDWPDLEIVVVDDRSRDGTGILASQAAEGDPRVRIIEGSEPPRGWAGKPWACMRAAGESSGELLLFVDADVQLDPGALRAMEAELRRRGLGLLSAFGSWQLEGFWERLVIPAVGWTIRGSIDLDRVNDAGQVDAFANGQVILVERRAYDAIGGHEAVADQVLDDVGLARALKQAGHGIGLVVAPWAFRVRLYRDLGEILAGYGKNLYEGMGRRPAIALGSILFILVGSLLPYLALSVVLVGELGAGWSILNPWWLGWLLAVCALQTGFRWRLEQRDGRPGLIALLHPLANLMLVLILARSILGVRSQWKGRRFLDGRAVPR